jgi:hypothetical protein
MVRALNIPLGRLKTEGAGGLGDADRGELSTPAGSGDDAALEPFDITLARWLVLSEAANSINRCMGLPDLYPFVISDATAGKLAFVHELLGKAAPERSASAAPGREEAMGGVSEAR